MLGRLPTKANSFHGNAPMSITEAPTVDMREELKVAIDLVCEFNDKLAKLNYQTREIVYGWLRERNY